MFHRSEAYRRGRESGPPKIAYDDDGKAIDIRQPGGECYDLEVARIIPCSIFHAGESKYLVSVAIPDVFRRLSDSVSRIILKS